LNSLKIDRNNGQYSLNYNYDIPLYNPYNISAQENCKNNWDELIVLQKLKDEIVHCKKEIKRIIKENFIEPEKKETNGEKEQKSYKVIDEDKIIDDNFTKIKLITKNYK